MLTLNRMLLMLGMFSCSLTHVKQQNQHLEVLQATSQQWVSGVRGGGGSINYKLIIKILTDKKVVFDSVWVAGKKLSIKIEKGTQNGEVETAKNRIVTLQASSYMGNPGKPNREEEEKAYIASIDSVKAPIKYKGAALFRYFVDGSAKYFPIATIKVIPTLHGQ